MTSSSSIEIRRHSKESPWTYESLDRRQREIAKRVLQGGAGAILLSEVAPVITIGRRTGPCDLLLPESALAERGIELYRADRGGFATWHGPGQWVLFVVDSLENLTGDRRGVRKAVDSLLKIALEIGKSCDPSAHTRSGAELGVWTNQGKFAALGVHIENGVLMHGLSINGFRAETSFVGIKPCGLDLPVDFLIEKTPEKFDQLGKSILDTAQKVFSGR